MQLAAIENPGTAPPPMLAATPSENKPVTQADLDAYLRGWWWQPGCQGDVGLRKSKYRTAPSRINYRSKPFRNC
jgi:hypothetical protein